MDSCLLKGWIVVFTLAQLCWAQDFPVQHETLVEVPSLVAVEEPVKAAFEQAEDVNLVKLVLEQGVEVPAEPQAQVVVEEDSVKETAIAVEKVEKEAQQPAEEVTTAEEALVVAETEPGQDAAPEEEAQEQPQQEELLVEAPAEAKADPTLEETPAAANAPAIEDSEEQVEAEPATGTEEQESQGGTEEVAQAAEGEEETTQGAPEQQEVVEEEVGAPSEKVVALTEEAEGARVETAAVDGAGKEGGEAGGESTEEDSPTGEGETKAGAEAGVIGLGEMPGEGDTAAAVDGGEDGGEVQEEAVEVVAVVAEGGEQPEELTAEEGEEEVVEVTGEETQGGTVVGVVPFETEDEEEEEEEEAIQTTDTSESDDEGAVGTDSTEIVGPVAALEDNTLAGEVVEKTNMVDGLIMSEEHLLVDPEAAEAAPTLVVESLEELPATPLGGDEEEEEEEDDVVEEGVNVLADSPEPKEDTSVGHEAWKIGAIAAAFFLVLQTVVTIVYILKCRKSPSSSTAPERACEAGGASAESGPAENTDTTLPAEDGLLQQNTVSDVPDLTQAQQEVDMTDIKLDSTEERRCYEESSHDIRTSVL